MPENTEKKLYELSYFISPDITDEEAIAYSQKIKDMLGVRADEVSKEEAPFKRRLAYAIKNKNQGYFGWFHFLAVPSTIKDLGKKLILDSSVLRHLIITVDKSQLAQLKKPAQAAAYEKTQKDVMDKEAVEKSIFKKEGAVSVQEEKKADLGDLDKKLEEVLNK
ncbi:MAG: 30S ribosomal protein S6 [Candidatus Azambacteria bacterium]|nr:30S ribosomal protein S6 [Candidatus Azambacteria bacterium]